MRFSLATLLLFIFWIGAAMPIWFWRVPWQHARSETRAEFEKHEPKRWAESEDGRFHAPDGRRICEWSSDPLPGEGILRLGRNPSPNRYRRLVIDDYSTLPETELFNFGSIGEPLGFADDDTLVFRYGLWEEKISPDDQVEIYHRRFPEWWWGHFYRPEVWLFIGLSGALIWRAARAVRARKSAAKGAA